MRFQYAYLHGFASSHKSKKGRLLAAAFARTAAAPKLHLPELNAPSFAQLTYTGALAEMDALDASQRAAGAGAKWRLVGSSMGGYLALRWAQLHPDRVDSLVLLCPGLRLTERWPVLFGADRMREWEQRGFVTVPDGSGTPTDLHFEFFRDAVANHPPVPPSLHRTLIVHGNRDDVVPVGTSQAFADANREQVRLLRLDDDHELLASADRIGAEAISFFGLDGGEEAGASSTAGRRANL